MTVPAHHENNETLALVQTQFFDVAPIACSPGTKARPRPKDRPRIVAPATEVGGGMQEFVADAEALPAKTKAPPRPAGRERHVDPVVDEPERILAKWLGDAETAAEAIRKELTRLGASGKFGEALHE